MQETTRAWLGCPSNRSVSGFRTVAELYLLHVLVPLSSRGEAEELILGEIGSSVFTADQRQTALELLEGKEQLLNSSQNSQPTAEAISAQGIPFNVHYFYWMQRKTTCLTVLCSAGTLLCKLEAMLKFFYRKLLSTRSGPFTFQRVFLAAMLLYMLFLRLDPGGSSNCCFHDTKLQTHSHPPPSFPAASPSSFMWISKLFQLLKQVWRALFAPYYQSKGL